MSFGISLKRERQKKGITQEALAEMVGCSAVMVSELEREKYQPRLDKANKMAKALDLTLDEMIKEQVEAAMKCMSCGSKDIVIREEKVRLAKPIAYTSGKITGKVTSEKKNNVYLTCKDCGFEFETNEKLHLI